MDDERNSVWQLRREARELPDGPTSVALLEEAVRRADALGDRPLTFSVRGELMNAAMHSGRPDLVLVAFAWCVAEFDRDPAPYNLGSLLWQYKWVVNGAAGFPEISRGQLDALFADMEARFRRAGHSLHAVFQKRRFVAMKLGDAERARAAHAEFVRTRRDSLSDCGACVPSEDCSHFTFLNDWQSAVAAAAPVISGGLSCAEEPRSLYSKVLLPLVRLGRLEEARQWHARGYRQMLRAEHAVEDAARHLTFVVLTGELARARELLERHFPAALAAVTPDDRFAFCLASRLLLDRLRKRGSTALKLRLPGAVPKPDEKGRHDLAALSEWLTTRAGEIAARYDARNGNRHFQKQIDELPRLLELPVD